MLQMLLSVVMMEIQGLALVVNPCPAGFYVSLIGHLTYWSHYKCDNCDSPALL